MAKTRQDLHNHLKTLIANVYYQPPENQKLKFDCIVYSRTRIDVTRADDHAYRLDHAYKLMYIHRSPDDPLIDTIASIDKCRFQRSFVIDQLYHDEYILYWN